LTMASPESSRVSTVRSASRMSWYARIDSLLARSVVSRAARGARIRRAGERRRHDSTSRADAPSSLRPQGLMLTGATSTSLRHQAGEGRMEAAPTSQRHIAQEDALHLRRLQQLLRRSAQDRPAGLEHVAAIGKSERQLHVLFDEDDPDVLLVADLADQRADLLHDLWRQPEERLVDHEAARPP